MGMEVFSLKATLGLDSSEYEKGLGDAKTKATSIGGTIGKGLATIGKATVAAVGVASAAVGKFAMDSVQAGGTFDKSMSQVAATMGYTVEQLNASEEEMSKMTDTERKAAEEAQKSFGQLRDFAQEMGSTTVFSASQASEALNYMALAGYDAETSMKMLPSVLDLAAAGNMDLARASDMVTDSQTAFGISNERVTQMVDEMAKAASTGNTSVEQLGDAFLVVGGLAQELNGGMVELSDGTTATYDNIQELEIALTAMANAGIKGGEAGTHLRNMLLKLASPTDDGVKQFEALGVSVFDNEGKMRSLSDIMGELGSSMENLTQEEKLQAISDIFNTRDTAAAEALLNAVGEDWDHIAESILDAEGAAGEMAKTQLDNLAGDVTLFKSALEGAQIAISDQLTPTLRQFVQFGSNGLSKITEAFKEGGLSGAMEAFGQILSDGLNMIIKMLPSFIDAGMQLLGALGKGILDNLPTIIDAAVQIVLKLVDGIVQALPQLVKGGIEVIVGLANGISKALPQLIPTIVEVIMQIIQTLYDNAPLLIEGGLNLIKGLAQGLIKAIPVLIKSLPTIIKSMVNYFVTAIPMLIDGAIELVNGIVSALPEIITALVEALPDIIKAIIDGLIVCLPMLIEGHIKLITALVAALPQIVSALINAIPTILETIVTTILSYAPMFMSAVTSIATSIWETIKRFGKNFVDTLVDNLKNMVDKANEGLKNLLDKTVQWLSQLPTKMAYYAGYAIGEFIKFFIELPSKVQNILTTVINNVIVFATNFVNKAREAAANFVNTLINGIVNLPSRVMNVLTSVLSNVAQFATNLINKAREAAAGFVNALVSGVSSLPSKFAEIGSNIVQGIWNGISGGWNWLKEKVSGLAQSLLQGAKDALGIESPSKEFAWVGRMVDEGFAKGIDDYAYLVDNALSDLTSAPNIELNANGGAKGARGGYNQVINITSPKALSPYEIARQTRNATRDMVLAMSI